MKILCLSDLHRVIADVFGLREQKHWIESLLKEDFPDVVVIAGDIFENDPKINPYENLHQLFGGLPVICTLGNHEFVDSTVDLVLKTYRDKYDPQKWNVHYLDILVYLKPDADIKPIAALKRKFQGRIARGTMGADIFLAENGKYIGRACCYKEPWVRVVCAQQKLCCNRDRIFLCDTSKSITLKPEIVANPPVVVYPEFSTENPIPNDLQEMIESVLSIKDDTLK